METKAKRRKAPKRKLVKMETNIPEITKLVDEKPRKVLGEGRSYGIGFALAKRKGTEIHLTGPISPCREYLNDQLSAEHSGKPYSCYGYNATKSGLLEDSHLFMVIAVMPNFNGSKYGELQDKETAHLAAHYGDIEKFVNYFEGMLKLEGRTVITKLEENRYVVISPLWWAQRTFLASLLSLLIRVALEGFYTTSIVKDPFAFFKESSATDCYYVGDVSKKIEALAKGELPPQDFTKASYWHSKGIVNQSFTTVKGEDE